MNRVSILIGISICIILASGCERSDMLIIDKSPAGMVTTVMDQLCWCFFDGESLQQRTNSAISIKKTDDGKLTIDANVYSDKELEQFPVGGKQWRVSTSPFEFAGDNYTVMFNDQVNVSVRTEPYDEAGNTSDFPARINGYITHFSKYYTKSDESGLQYVITIVWARDGQRHEFTIRDGLRNWTRGD